MPACAGGSSHFQGSGFYSLEQKVEGNGPCEMPRGKASRVGLPVTGTRQCVKNR